MQVCGAVVLAESNARTSLCWVQLGLIGWFSNALERLVRRSNMTLDHAEQGDLCVVNLQSAD